MRSLICNHILPIVLASMIGGCTSSGLTEEWRTATGTNQGMRYAANGDITAENVHRLRVAWEYDTGDSIGKGSTIPTTPLMVNGMLYGVSPNQHLFALDRKSTRLNSSHYCASRMP